MHHIEGAASGMPVLYHAESGGIVELCKNHGEEFTDLSSFLAALDVVTENYNAYVNRINYDNLSIDKCCENFYEIIQEMFD